MKKLALTLLSFALVVVSCKKQTQHVEPNLASHDTLQVQQKLSGVTGCNATVTQNGYLSFETEDDINEYLRFLETHSTDEINAFEQSNNFESYDRKVESILVAYQALNESPGVTASQIQDFRQANSSYLTITDDDFTTKI